MTTKTNLTREYTTPDEGYFAGSWTKAEELNTLGVHSPEEHTEASWKALVAKAMQDLRSQFDEEGELHYYTGLNADDEDVTCYVTYSEMVEVLVAEATRLWEEAHWLCIASCCYTEEA